MTTCGQVSSFIDDIRNEKGKRSWHCIVNPEQRQWKWLNFVAFWVADSLNIVRSPYISRREELTDIVDRTHGWSPRQWFKMACPGGSRGSASGLDTSLQPASSTLQVVLELCTISRFPSRLERPSESGVHSGQCLTEWLWLWFGLVCNHISEVRYYWFDSKRAY